MLGEGSRSADIPDGGSRSGLMPGRGFRSADMLGGGSRSALIPDEGFRSADIIPGRGSRSADMRSLESRSADISGGESRSADLTGGGSRAADMTFGGSRSVDVTGGRSWSADMTRGGCRSADMRCGGSKVNNGCQALKSPHKQLNIKQARTRPASENTTPSCKNGRSGYENITSSCNNDRSLYEDISSSGYRPLGPIYENHAVCNGKSTPKKIHSIPGDVANPGILNFYQNLIYPVSYPTDYNAEVVYCELHEDTLKPRVPSRNIGGTRAGCGEEETARPLLQAPPTAPEVGCEPSVAVGSCDDESSQTGNVDTPRSRNISKSAKKLMKKIMQC